MPRIPGDSHAVSAPAPPLSVGAEWFLWSRRWTRSPCGAPVALLIFQKLPCIQHKLSTSDHRWPTEDRWATRNWMSCKADYLKPRGLEIFPCILRIVSRIISTYKVIYMLNTNETCLEKIEIHLAIASDDSFHTLELLDIQCVS